MRDRDCDRVLSNLVMKPIHRKRRDCVGHPAAKAHSLISYGHRPMARKSNPGTIHLRIIEVMKRFPRGISGGQISHELEKEGLEPSEQTHLDRRKRDLKKWF